MVDTQISKQEIKKFLTLRLLFSLAVTTSYVFWSVRRETQQSFAHFDKLIIELSSSEQDICTEGLVTKELIEELILTNAEFRSATESLMMGGEIPELEINPTLSQIHITRGGAQYNSIDVVTRNSSFLEKIRQKTWMSFMASIVFMSCFGFSTIIVKAFQNQVQAIQQLETSGLIQILSIMQGYRDGETSISSRIDLLFNKGKWLGLKTYLLVQSNQKFNLNAISYFILNILDLFPGSINLVLPLLLAIGNILAFGVGLGITIGFLVAPPLLKFLIFSSCIGFFVLDIAKYNSKKVILLSNHLLLLFGASKSILTPLDIDDSNSAGMEITKIEGENQPRIQNQFSDRDTVVGKTYPSTLIGPMEDSHSYPEWPKKVSTYPDDAKSYFSRIPVDPKPHSQQEEQYRQIVGNKETPQIEYQSEVNKNENKD